ncbi:MFS transporter [Flavobacterium sp. UMI-01]|uniref:MFS transporter n=1 Tax=Flavobacterium sp. UMI-01 TaxID=1441053 RepID=UPI001C7D237B|nr:MFS transporter [Flavobacterium sp. UMI-01]GIZ09333.1 MFS transporter [Flavobacterium sp. UMI-01]
MIRLNFIGNYRAQGKIKKSFRKAKQSYLRRIRWAVSSFYFGMGLCFATWASRIPDIKVALDLSPADLGSILLALPLGQLTMMPFSGKLVTRYGSHRLLLFSLSMYAVCLSNMGLAVHSWQLALGLFLFGMCGNMNNIAVNTQGVYTEKLYNKNIMSSFHGVWSFAGFIGALIGILMLAIAFTPFQHFLTVAFLVFTLVAVNFKFLIKAKESPKSNEKRKLFTKPDPALVWLGVIGFGCMASEGIMFDWSGVYFEEIVQVPGPLIVLGYTSYMIMMATGRFLGDGLITRFGRKNVIQISGVLISTGLFTAVFFPYLIPATAGFMLVGLGVSTIVPTIYSVAGKTPHIPPGEAIAMVTSVSFLGFLMGPPVIGFIAELFGLRFSFAFIGIFGLIIAFLVSKIQALR